MKTDCRASYNLISLRTVILLLFGLVCAFLAFPAVNILGMLRLALEADADKDYSTAEKLYLKTIEMTDTVVDRDTKGFCLFKSYDRLSSIYELKKRYREAIATNRSVLRHISENGYNEYDKVLPFVKIGNIYLKTGDREKAECHYDSAMNAFMVTEIPRDFLLANGNLLAITLGKVERYDDSLEILRLMRRYCSPLSLEEESTIEQVTACTLWQKRNIPEAAKHYKRHADLAARLHGEDSDEYRYALYNVANILAYNGDIEEGSAIYCNVAQRYTSLLRRNLRTLPAGKRDSRLNELRQILYDMTPFAIAGQHKKDFFSLAAYEGELMVRGCLLYASRETSRLLSRYGSKDDLRQHAEIGKINARLATMHSKGADADSIAMVYASLQKADSILAERCKDYGDIGAFTSTGFRDISSALADNEAVVEIVDYHPQNTSRQYAAYIYREGDVTPLLTPLCSGSLIESLLKAGGNDFAHLHREEAAGILRDSVFSKIADACGNVSQIYYIPSGEFHFINPNAVVDSDSGRNFIRLSHAREIIKSRNLPKTPGRAIAIGGISYPEALGFSPIPGSLHEIKEMSHSLGNAVDVSILSGSAATVEGFDSICRLNPEIIHIAAHGFFFDSNSDEIPEKLKGYHDVMHLSGLTLAGGEPLSSSEIALKNLSSTRLVTLAVCNSGKGKSTPEGLFGLMRGFKSAGVDTMLVALWQVSDVASELFFSVFYSNLEASQWNVRVAFRKAVVATRKRYPDPYYWAGFTLID